MRPTSAAASTLLLPLLVLISSVSAFTITYPVTGSVVDTSKDVKITWTTDPSDPAMVNILLNQQLGGSDSLATNVATSGGSYTVPANTIKISAGGYFLSVDSTASEGNAYVAQSGVFDLNTSNTISSTTLGVSSTAVANGTVSTATQMSATVTAGATYGSITGTTGASTAYPKTINAANPHGRVPFGFGAAIAGFAAVLL